MEEELRRRLLVAKGVARSLIVGEELQEDFVSYCAKEFVRGRNLKTPIRYLYIDFLRITLSRLDVKKVSHVTIDNYPSPESRDEFIDKLSDKILIEKLLKKLDLEEQLIIYFYFFDDIPMIKIGDIFGVSEARIHQRLKKIFAKLRGEISFVEKLELQV